LDTETPSASMQPVSVEPQSIGFGCLKPGEAVSATLKISGGPVKVIVHSSRLKVTPPNLEERDGELQVALQGSDDGELVWDYIVLKGDSGEQKVLVTARWQEESAEEERGSVVKEPEPSVIPQEVRNFKGKVCPWCRENIRYDTGLKQWVECKNCRGARKILSIIRIFTREFWLGMKDTGSFVAEKWRALTKEKK